MPQQRVIIIGAGIHGLIAAKTYLQLDPNIDLTIIESGNTVGGVWNDERLYPELYAQVTHGFFEFTDLPLEKEHLSPLNFISGIALNKYLDKFTKKFNLLKYIRFRTWVKLIQELPDSRWTLKISHEEKPGIEEILECDKLIVASGTANTPEIPRIPQFDFRPPVRHSKEMLEYSAALESQTVERVTVIGAAKAAYDAVYLAMRAGKRVDWIIRPNGRGPLSVYPATMFGINSMNIGFSQWFIRFSPSIDATDDWWYWALHTTWIGILVTKIFWMIVTAICNAYAGYGRSENAGKLRPMPNSVFWCNAGCGIISNPHMWELFHHSGLVTVHRQNIASFTENHVVLEGSEKTALRTDFVLLCTGWKDNLTLFSPRDWSRLGLPHFDRKNSHCKEDWENLEREADEKIDNLFPILSKPPAAVTPIIPNRNVWRQYRRMVPPELAAKGSNSIVFLGQIYLMQTMLHAEVQALWAVSYLLGRIEVPDLKSMQREVAGWNSWTRKRYLHRGNTMPYAIYETKACCDKLLKDLKINIKRKPNWFLEIFSPYGPRDYTGLVAEYQEVALNSKDRSQNTPVFRNYCTAGSLSYTTLILFATTLLLARLGLLYL